MENKQGNTKLQDEGRLAYMIAWRDKRISMLQDMLDEMEQSNLIFAAYITFLLEKLYGREGYITVPKKSIRDVCGKYRVTAEDGGDDYILRLIEVKTGNEIFTDKMADA
jgi:hypothetical protein